MFVKRAALSLAITVITISIIIGSFPFFSRAEGAPLTPEELAAYADSVRAMAETDGFYNAEAAAGGYALRFKDFELYASAPRLSADTDIWAVRLDTLPEDGEDFRDPRGVCIGMTLEEVLSRYPLDNPALAGTREEACLCARGAVPGTAFTGVLYRDGQTVRSVLYTLYAVSPGGMAAWSVEYRFFSGAVMLIDVYTAPEEVSLRAAQERFGTCRDLLLKNEYSAYLPASQARPAEPFGAEDLLFSGLDFLRLTPETAGKILGGRYEETWVADGGEWLQTLSWQGISVTFVCDENRQPLFAGSLFLEEDLLEGPRGLMPGCLLSDILSRFPCDEAAFSGTAADLYRLDDDQYGQLEQPVDGVATVRYVCAAGGRRVLLRLYTEGGVLKNLTLQVIRS